MNTDYREKIKNKKRIVVKVGTSSLIHKETGGLDLIKVEHLVRELSDLHNRGKDVILVTSGAIGASGEAGEHPHEAGLRSHRTGETDDDLSEIFR